MPQHEPSLPFKPEDAISKEEWRSSYFKIQEKLESFKEKQKNKSGWVWSFIITFAMMAIVGFTSGSGAYDKLHNFQTDAVELGYAYWNIDREFSWNNNFVFEDSENLQGAGHISEQYIELFLDFTKLKEQLVENGYAIINPETKEFELGKFEIAVYDNGYIVKYYYSSNYLWGLTMIDEATLWGVKTNITYPKDSSTIKDTDRESEYKKLLEKYKQNNEMILPFNRVESDPPINLPFNDEVIDNLGAVPSD